MKNHLFLILAYLIVLTFLFQPIQTLANSDQVKIYDNLSLAAAQTPAPGEPYPEQFEKEFEMEIEAERQRLLEEHFREEGMPEELLSHEYGSDPQEKPEYIPPSEEVIAQTKAQVDSFSCASVTDVPVIECEALVALYESTNGAGWGNNYNWLITNTVDNWYGITVSSGHVHGIYLTENNLNGSIPVALGNLSELEVLWLFDNQLNGSIPPELGNLSNLYDLDLGINQLNGSIPPQLGNLSNLQDLDLHWNKLSGSIPPELGNLSNLEYLNLIGNQLSGSIPPELGNLSELNYLVLLSNQLNGSIPPELGNLSNLNHLDLYSNQLSGSIPPEIGNLSNLNFLDLGRNQLSGSIPAELGNLNNLQELWLNENQLSGSIPVELGNLSELNYLVLHTNQLSGSITPELGNLSNLVALTFTTNQLSGSIPPELGNLSNLWWLDLRGNQLSGSIPPALGNLSNLDYLYLDNNQLSGGIPPALGNLSNLHHLYLSENPLSGSIPPALGNLNNLDRLTLSDNQLSGSIPPELGNLSELYILDLNNNQLSGSIPADLGNLSYLNYLYLSNNQLSGSIPPELGNLSSLVYLYLNNNQLSGSIPLSFVNLTNLNVFDFSDTFLCEPTDEGFIAWKETVQTWEGTNLICEIEEGNIYFYPNPDGYQFNNWGSTTPNDYTIEDMRRMFGDDTVCWKMIGPICIPNLQAIKFMNKMDDELEGGHCLGMSVSSLRFFRSIDTHNGHENTFDLNKSDTVQINWDDYEVNTSVRKNISYFQVLQYTNPIKEYQNLIIKRTPNEILNMLSNSMNSGNQDDNILLISRLAGEIGHAITPYAIENIGDGIYFIKVYDNNYPNNSNQHVIVNTNNNTWIYNQYSGDVYSKSFGIAPISLYNQRPICPWCESDLHSYSEKQVWFEGNGNLLITDSQMRKLGFQDDVYYDEIPDAYGSPSYGGLEIANEPIYTLPLIDEFTITINGSQTEVSNESSITAFGPGYAVFLEDVLLNSDTHDMLLISNDGTSVSYQASQPQQVTLGLIFDTEDANWQLETKQLEMTAGDQKTLSAETSDKILELSSSQTSTGSYDIYFTRTGNDSIDLFYNASITIEAGSTHLLHFDGWQTTGTVQCDIDENGDGDPDETVYLENQLKMLYLPVIWH